jgi:hypothetical protein
MRKPRPSLGAVLGAATSPVPAPAKAAQRAPGKRRSGCVQLNVLIPEGLKRDAQIKALRTGRDLSDVVAGLLSGWIGEQTSSDLGEPR